MNDKYFVYQHIREDKGSVFYIGIGKICNREGYNTYKLKHYRAFTKSGRNSIWKLMVKKTSFKVEIVADYISFDSAKRLEIELIKKYGKIKDNSGGILTNVLDGGETVPDEMRTVLNDPKFSQAVYQYDVDGKFIKSWPSTNQIKRELGFDNSTLRKCLTGKTKSPNISYGYQWFLEYKGELIDPSDFGKTSLHRGVIMIKDNEQLIFHSREQCAKKFKVESGQITNAINSGWKFRGYKIGNYENKKE